jgi:DNA-directed RNA polymerase subunit beta'
MAYLDHNEANVAFKDAVLAGIQAHFPIKGKVQTLSLDRLEVKDEDLHSDDIRLQHRLKVEGKTLGAPVYAHLRLHNHETGKEVVKRMRIAEVPMMTRRYSYLIDGKEYQVENQWQLKPGAYTRRLQTGELTTHFNVVNRPSFILQFDPATKQFVMERGSSHVPLYPLLNALGVPDAQLAKDWGKDVLAANQTTRGVGAAVEKFHRADRRPMPADHAEALAYVRDSLEGAALRPEVTQMTLGKPLDHAGAEALRLATRKILAVHGGAHADDRDSLAFKDLRGVPDFAEDKLKHWQTKAKVHSRAVRKINTAKSPEEIVRFDTFNQPVRDVFDSAVAHYAFQFNPIEMMGSAMATTIRGPGGIQGEHAVVNESKFLNPSHLGFLDPLQTPEGESTGVSLRLPLGVVKRGRVPYTPLYSMKTGRMELVDPAKFGQSRVVLADQVRWEGNKPVAVGPVVKMAGEHNELHEGRLKDADYVMRRPSQAFSVASNLIPYLGNTFGVRGRVATTQLEQSLSLEDRQAPLVQVGTGVDQRGYRTFEQMFGKHSAHFSPVDGQVVSVARDAVVVKSADGAKHEVQMYHNFPLNHAGAVLHATPLVQAGDKVVRGQVVADTNFTKNGTLALGTNLKVAYIPYKGYNFEDGVVISDTAARKLSSGHMYKLTHRAHEQSVVVPEKFDTLHSGVFTQEQLKKVDAHGVVRVGQQVQPGDPLRLSTKPYLVRDRTDVGVIRRLGTQLDDSQRWEGEHAGEVVAVHRKGDEVTVHVRTVEPMKVGDKLAGRYGNKGVVSRILSDHEMPHGKDGPMEVLLNPLGVAPRMNIGQMLEVAGSKIARKTGRTYVANNFEPHVDQLAKMQRELKQHGLSDTEELHDPVTGVPLGRAMTGEHYMLKLMQQVDKGTGVRSGLNIPGLRPEAYDLNMIPLKGEKTGGQAAEPFTLYSLLAHGARANIREMQTWKSEGNDPRGRWPTQHQQVWNAIQTGQPLPAPKPTFAYHKFEAMLRAAGINVDKQGHQLQLTPLTDRQILRLSSGALPKPAELTESKLDKNGDPKPRKGGLFDPELTGGHGGMRWTHIKLSEPIPNPTFERAIQRLTGLSQDTYHQLVSGEQAVDREGKPVAVGHPGSTTGGAAIKQLLSTLDTDKELRRSRAELDKMKVKGVTDSGATAKLDQALKRVKHLEALKQLGLQPVEAYVLHNLPVMPPIMRPASVLPDGSIRWEDLNGLYSRFGLVNMKLGDPQLKRELPARDQDWQRMRTNLYDGVKAVMGIGQVSPDSQIDRGQKKLPSGVLKQLHGSSPKFGYFQNTLMHRRQDMSMRGVIVPEPSLGLDEVGLPRDKALDLYRPFVVKQLVHGGAAGNPLDAQLLIKKGGPLVDHALDRAVAERPVLLKRDPVLHKHGIQAFKPRLISGQAIQIHPLVTGGYNADFDGDKMAAFLPISREAVEEAHKMFPSNMLFNEATGRVAYAPTMESALGLYKLSRVTGEHAHKYGSPAEAVSAAVGGKLPVTDLVHMGGPQKTTVGRLLLAQALPQPMQQAMLTGREPMTVKATGSLLAQVADGHAGDYGRVSNALKDLGNGMSFGALPVLDPQHVGARAIRAAEDPKKNKVYIPVGTHTLSLSDFTADRKARDPVVKSTREQVAKVKQMTGLTAGERNRRSVELWERADDRVWKAHEQSAKLDPSNLRIMYDAGVKPSRAQYKQLVLAPMVLEGSHGQRSALPVTRSYAEGFDLGDYWTHAYGARQGTMKKVLEVQDPGVLSKNLINTSMSLVVADHDCGTNRGVALSVMGQEAHGRELARSLQIGHVHLPKGTMLTPPVLDKVRAADKNAQVVVRSTLKCELGQGVCQKCAGSSASGTSHKLGTNLGVIASQSLGERATQLTLKAFHIGGAGGRGGLLNDFARAKQLFNLPEQLPNAATLSMESGKIDRVEEHKLGTNIWVNGVQHFVGRDFNGQPLHQPLVGVHSGWVAPKAGMKVEAGQSLSDPTRTTVNPRDLYRATKNIERVQNHLVDELHNIYRGEGVRRGHIETLVKTMSNLTRVHEPGDVPHLLKGEFRPLSALRAQNAELVRQGRQPAKHEPVLKGVETMPLFVYDDWMAKMMHHEGLRPQLIESASVGARSNPHGLHPVPGMAMGAEFGLTREHQHQPGMAHLKDVPRHVY